MTSRSDKGLALILVAGILVFLSAAGFALMSLASGLERKAGIHVNTAQAGILARSGIEYAASRLWEDPAFEEPTTAENQPDDWRYRDDPSVPPETARNPSYAQTEPYRETGVPDGRYDAGIDLFQDLNGNRAFDAWSGRLRSGSAAGGTFALKIAGEQGKIPVNQGILDREDRNANAIPDHRDPGRGLYSVGFYSYYDQVSCRNLRIADLISTLWLLVSNAGGINAGSGLSGLFGDVRSIPVGRRIVEKRPPGGYRTRSELRSALSPLDWDLLGDYLSTEIPEGVTFGIGKRELPLQHLWIPERRFPIKLALSPRILIQALQVGLSMSTGEEPESLAKVPHLVAGANIVTIDEADRVARNLKSRTHWPSLYVLHQELDRMRNQLFLDGMDSLQVEAVMNNANPDQAGVRTSSGYQKGVRGTPPYSWWTYDGERLDAIDKSWKITTRKNADGRDRRAVPTKADLWGVSRKY